MQKVLGAVIGPRSQGTVGPRHSQVPFPGSGAQHSVLSPSKRRGMEGKCPSLLQAAGSACAFSSVPWRRLLWRSKDRAGVRRPGFLSWLCPVSGCLHIPVHPLRPPHPAQGTPAQGTGAPGQYAAVNEFRFAQPGLQRAAAAQAGYRQAWNRKMKLCNLRVSSFTSSTHSPHHLKADGSRL